MSTDQTPALARATEALRNDERERLGADKTCPPSYWPWPRLARVAVSAALHDPDDDVIARTLRKHPVLTVLSSGPGCNCGAPWDREVHRAPTFWFAIHQADAVRAAILGSAS